MNAITNIQKYSIHDGDGIRTTVFYKGCPLRCEWCHNPETQRFNREMQFDVQKCTGCQRCAEVCPQQAISFSGPGAPAVTDPERCTLCGRCVDRCINEAREIIGETYSQKDLVKELMKDQIFYDQSG
ncbi:MAG: 4Fe-4S binding protein, partial [Eubacterium sp.]|nr:4Fe-4S binding protein [Eubacterium sp.]